MGMRIAAQECEGYGLAIVDGDNLDISQSLIQDKYKCFKIIDVNCEVRRQCL